MNPASPRVTATILPISVEYSSATHGIEIHAQAAVGQVGRTGNVSVTIPGGETDVGVRSGIDHEEVLIHVGDAGVVDRHDNIAGFESDRRRFRTARS